MYDSVPFLFVLIVLDSGGQGDKLAGKCSLQCLFVYVLFVYLFADVEEGGWWTLEKLAGQGLRQFECGDGTTANTPLQLPPPII